MILNLYITEYGLSYEQDLPYVGLERQKTWPLSLKQYKYIHAVYGTSREIGRTVVCSY